MALSVGGFHPDFNPAPMIFPPSLTRVAMTRGSRQEAFYLRFEGYYAMTTNTLQLGASVECVIQAAGFVAQGFLGFDVLIRFQPFFFQFSFRVAFSIAYGGITLAGIRVAGCLSGPGPVTFTGEITFEILLVRISWRDTFLLGSDAPPAVRAVRALDELQAELSKVTNLAAVGGGDPYVNLDTGRIPANLPVLPPGGRLVWSQKRAPLNLLLQRFEGAPLAIQETITITGRSVLGPELDWFAPGSFAELTDSEALNRRSFDRLQAGVQLGSNDIDLSNPLTHSVSFEEYILPSAKPAKILGPLALDAWLLAALDDRSGVGIPPSVAPSVRVLDEQWEVRGSDGSLLVYRTSESQAHQLARVAGDGSAAVPAGRTLAVPTF